ncbi:pyridoxal-phosphate dependent enzyme [Pararhizobium sp. DWP1-1-3]|uniref:pyridoxal-phosphate dependent enzyme n=1 Tax=Pararhizobium sp. DWP1-1-3 TaxID=2804652 RepID=UPI003CE74B0E
MTQPRLQIPVNPTALSDCPALARRADVGRVLVKVESGRPFGNFKILGGMTAALRALSRITRTPVAQLPTHRDLPRLICASDGNHGLAVAAAAKIAGAPATIYLHHGVPRSRADRIIALGASVYWIAGTYDHAVDAAIEAARVDGILVPDTSSDVNDPIVRDVMSGYATMTNEIAVQLAESAIAVSHQFIQAGVGGLAAAMAQGLPKAKLAIVEPENAACVAPALAAGRVVRIDSSLHTCAEMLACGEASAPALAIFQRHNPLPVLVSEAGLLQAAEIMRQEADIHTTPSGSAGLAGLLQVARRGDLSELSGLDRSSTVLLVATEAHPDAFCRDVVIELEAACRFAAGFFPQMGA